MSNEVRGSREKTWLMDEVEKIEKSGGTKRENNTAFYHVNTTSDVRVVNRA